MRLGLWLGGVGAVVGIIVSKQVQRPAGIFGFAVSSFRFGSVDDRVSPQQDSTADFSWREIQREFRQWRETDDPDARRNISGELLKRITASGAPDIIPRLSADELNSDLGSSAINRWLAVDTARAAHWVASRAEVTAGQLLLVRQNLLRNQVGLLDYCRYFSTDSKADKILPEVLTELGTRDPFAAIQAAQLVTIDEMKSDVLQKIIDDWLSRDAAGAMAWLGDKPAGANRDQLTCLAALAGADRDPLKSVELVVSSVQSDDLMNQTLLPIIQVWADQRPAQAASLVDQLPEGAMRTTAIAIVARSWMRSNPMTAYIWIKGLPEVDGLISGLPPG